MYKSIPTYDGEWTITEFDSDKDFIRFLLQIFKEPGNYDFNEISFLFNEQANNFNKKKSYIFLL